jgi:glucose-fructose oxidoreductase
LTFSSKPINDKASLNKPVPMSESKETSRRSFIRSISATTFALGASGLPSAFAAPAAPAKRKLGIALVGLGNYSRDLLGPGLLKTEHCHLAGIVTGTPAKEKIWMEKYGIPQENVYNYANFDRIAENKNIDVVYIVLPNSMHHEFTIRAARAGKHVICEKPMAMDAREAMEMIQACKDAKVGLSIGYRMRYEPHTLEIERFARESTYGAIRFVSVDAGFRMSRPTKHWKGHAALGGGALMDMGPYPIQAARYAVGAEPVAVTARHLESDPPAFPGVDETTTFQLEFPNGVFAQCMTTFAGNVNSLRVCADKGNYGLEPFCSYSGIRGFLPNGETLVLPEAHQQARQMDEMCKAFLEGRPSRTPGEEGLRDMRIIDAIRESVKHGGKRIVL